MTNPDGFPIDPAEQPPVAPAIGLDPSLNPFAGNQPVEQQPSRLGLGGNILSQAGVLIPSAPEVSHPDGEVVSSAEQAAKKACGQIAEMFIKETDPDSIVFPICDDIAAINLALQQVGNTPLGLGFGKFPYTVPRALSRFLRETTANYRRSNNLEAADLAPVHLQLPDWLKENPSFDFLEGCELMDIEIEGVASSVIATNARYCRVRFKQSVSASAVIGTGAQRSTFIIEGHMFSQKSFENASNVTVEIKGNQQGELGPMSTSAVSCEGQFVGRFYMNRGTGCKVGRGISLGNGTREV